MEKILADHYISLGTDVPIWNRCFTVAPLIVVGTKEGDNYDLAPKHMATAIGLSNYFGFVCTPKHATYRNVKATGEFSVSFPLPNQIVLSSLSASPRCGERSNEKSIIRSLPTVKATSIDALLLDHSYLYLECKLFKIIDGFDNDSIITGKVITAFVKSNYHRDAEKDEQEMIKDNPLLAYIANGRFASVSETFNFPFPKGFKR
ncbi:flavin reductase [Sediminicola arcticus]|jgi:flavin reductase (DIM6/NTAB) family NADH-FMN oxidoreductase RutF|uniref:Flavin reductase n=1 Tax=Sediminicola arcticus TaxID=1574308 RepID=A0ABV2STS7_9FLAO